MKQNNLLNEVEKKKIARFIFPLIEEDISQAEMGRRVKEELDIPSFNHSNNPERKFRNLYKTKSFQEILKEVAESSADEVTEGTEVISQSFKKNGEIEKEVKVITPDANLTFDNPEDIMRHLGFDPKKFKLLSSSVRKSAWNGMMRGYGILDLYAYKLSGSVRPLDVNEVSFEEVKDTLRGIMEDYPYKEENYEDVKIDEDEEGKIAIVSIADLHLGKLAWAPECGESYDHKIAMRRYRQIIKQSVERLKQEKNLEEIIFFWSQDFFHYDNLIQTTTAGTFQQSDLRWQKMFDLGTRLLIEGIEALKQIAKVTTFYTRSNHDEQVSYYAKAVISTRYESDSRVQVIESPYPRKYLKYGVNLLGFGHGDKERKRIFSLMSIEAPEYWGSTSNREFFLGHFHSQRVYEESGVIVRHLSSPCGTDAWHTQSGFVGAQKGSQIFIRGEKSGQIAEYNINFTE